MISYFLQNYFTKILEDNLKAIIKPQYVDHIPKVSVAISISICDSVLSFLVTQCVTLCYHCFLLCHENIFNELFSIDVAYL
jgi:hypothetical protein